MQPARQCTPLNSYEPAAAAIDGKSHSPVCYDGRDASKEIGVIGGISKVLVSFEARARASSFGVERSDFELMLDESRDGNRIWIEVVPPNQSVALLLSKRTADEVQQEGRDLLEGSMILLNCEDFHRTHNQLIGRGAKFLAGPARMPFGWLSMFEDTEGRRFVLGQW